MELGTGIFLSTLVIAVVVLYGITKDRWNWRRVVKRSAFVCLGLVLLGGLVGAGVYLYDYLPITVSRQTEYGGIRLGMSQDEVRYIKGYPPTVLAEDVSDPQYKDFLLVIDTNKLEKGKSVGDYRHWSYNERNRNINFAFDGAKTVSAISCYSEDKRGRCPAIAGVEDGAPEKKVLRVFGKNPQARIDGVSKSLTYPDLGVRLHLTKEEVYMLEISTPGYVR